MRASAFTANPLVTCFAGGECCSGSGYESYASDEEHDTRLFDKIIKFVVCQQNETHC